MPEYFGPLAPVGFDNPHETSSLLAYRLPAWGYRAWSLEADLKVGGEAVDGEKNIQNKILSALDFHRESEEWSGSLALDFSGSYSRTWEGDWSRSRFSLAGNFEAEGRNFVWRDVGLIGGLSYREFREESRTFDYPSRLESGNQGLNPVVGVSLGRIRNVVPLLRAKRMSQRLVALGRLPLQDHQLQWLAGVFATHSSYLAVYDREDRTFWGTVLADVAGTEPLKAYEVLFLREVLSEFLGNRSEGWEIQARYVNSEFGFSTDLVKHDRAVILRYAHNLDLNRYLEVEGYGFSSSYDNNQYRSARLELGFMWILANRLHWLSDFSAQVSDDWMTSAVGDESIRVSRRLRLSSSLDYFLEDQLKLTPRVYAGWSGVSPDTPIRDGSQSWGVGLEVTWYFDRVLY